MAGEGWVMGIIWHVLVLARNTIVDVWGGWSMEILLGASFLMQLVLTFSAGFRWRGDSPMLRNVIWLFYVSGDFVATLALGHLSVSGTSGKRRLVAFWAPFFLLHLGGPDSITAYELEDNQLSARYVLELVLRVTGAVYIVYKSISGSWALVPAAWLMLFVGVAKYTEKTLALHGANLVNVRSSVERQQQHQRTEGGSRHPRKLAFEVDDDDNDLVMKAHSLFHICKNSIVDSSVVAESDIEDAVAAQTKKTLFGLEWKELFTVMEIELSLMYDFLYTKAAIIHTWHGYCIRVLSPLATTVSLVLVELSNEGGRRHKRSDIVITRVLLVATFLLELASLLRALSSTWTGFLLHNKLRPGWIRHEVLCMRRWHRFHRVITSLGWPAKVQDHRQWLGKMGQLNMLELVITQKEPAPKGGQFWDKEYQRCSKNTMIIPKEVKKLVLERVSIHLKKLRDLMKRAVVQARVEAVPEDTDLLKMAVFLRTERGQETIEKNDKLSDLRWSLGDEPQLDILTWHIATDMFLLLSGKAAEAKDEGTGDEGLKVEAIMTLSNYMMYLLVVSPYMLPGLVTRKIIKLSCEDLARIWSEHWPPPAAADHLESSSSSPSFCNVRFFMPSKFFSQYGQWRVPTRLSQGREDLAKMLMDWHKSRDNAVTLNTYLHGGVRLAMNMLHVEKRHNKEELDIVQVILDVWVSMLFYASYQCSKESHAKQLSQGGELTTIVWLMAEHFGLFIVNKTSKGTEDNGRTGKEAKASDSQNV